LNISVVDRLGTVMGEVEEALRRASTSTIIVVDTVEKARHLGSEIIRAAGQRPGSIYVLRFFSHGSVGAQGVYTLHSPGVAGDVARALDGVTGENTPSRAMNAFLGAGTTTYGFGFERVNHPREFGLDLIGSYFMVGGRAEFHGCSVAQGAKGHRFVQGCADMWGVEVVAGESTQLHVGGHLLRFEGPVLRLRPRAPSGRSPEPIPSFGRRESRGSGDDDRGRSGGGSVFQ
jgi:hypothetical protein